MNELKESKFSFNHSIPKIKCCVFEDNMSCIEIAINHRTRPRTKHLSVRLHHFRYHVINKTISIEHISTKEQIADMFTKPLPCAQFQKLCDRLMCWTSISAVREWEIYRLLSVTGIGRGNRHFNDFRQSRESVTVTAICHGNRHFFHQSRESVTVTVRLVSYDWWRL